MIQIRNCSKYPGVTAEVFSYPADWALDLGSVSAAIVAWCLYSHWIDLRNHHIVVDEVKLFETTCLSRAELESGFEALAVKGILEEIEGKPDTVERVVFFDVRKLEASLNDPESPRRAYWDDTYDLIHGAIRIDDGVPVVEAEAEAEAEAS